MDFAIHIEVSLSQTFLLCFFILFFDMTEKCEKIFVFPFLIDHRDIVFYVFNRGDDCLLLLPVISMKIQMNFSLR